MTGVASWPGVEGPGVETQAGELTLPHSLNSSHDQAATTWQYAAAPSHHGRPAIRRADPSSRTAPLGTYQRSYLYTAAAAAVAAVAAAMAMTQQ